MNHYFNRKTTVSPTRQQQQQPPHHHRHRSHTISKIACDSVGDAAVAAANHHSIVNRCGYDSFLHATICSNNVVATSSVNNSPIRTHSHPTGGTPAKILQNYNNRAIRARHKSNEPAAGNIFLTGASPQLQGYTKLNSSHHQQHSKLNTSALSQLNPQLTPEQKFSRTINHVERWLNERDDHVLIKTNNTDQRLIKFAGVVDETMMCKQKLRDIAKDEKNLDNLINTKMFADKLKMTEKFTEKFSSESPAKKTFNKEVLLGRRGIATAVVAATSSTPVKQRSLTATVTAASASTAVPSSPAAVVVIDSNKSAKIMEFSSIPIQVEASECENLLRASCSDDSVASCVDGGSAGGVGDGSSSAVHRYVHEHIHHHYHHFENTTSDIL